MVSNGATVFKYPILVLNIQYLWGSRRSVQRAEDYINNVTWYCGKHTWPGKAESGPFSWQMGPCRILQSVVPPYGGLPAPDMQKTHVPAVFVLATCARQLWRLTITPVHMLTFHPLKWDQCFPIEWCHYWCWMFNCKPLTTVLCMNFSCFQ